ncbi:autotransporter assembly complex family protein [Pantoea sp. Mhis]|uniref:autotransporter assembly complex protein TamA n=1 Tax=Pantoea sp. Mhis TaxID=2576759 RepID=UPI001359A881|nr:autotransporter assembly complex family protein [Pantoea sp. Mhis]MXP56388.1 outer membrane protein assembly factor [Pantoea sp. Mhis]
MPKIYRYYLICLLFIVHVVKAEKIYLQLQGIKGELQEDVRSRLSMINTDEIDDIIYSEDLQERILKAIKISLRVFGYYEPDITFNFYSNFSNKQVKKKQGSSILVVHVVLGKSIKIGGSSIIIDGDAKYDFEYQAWLRDNIPKIGDRLNHGKYDDFKKGLSNISLRLGYFDGEFKYNRLAIYVKRHKAFWEIRYNSGKRYHFDGVNFQGTQIRESYLQKIVPFKKGDPYNYNKILELNQRLSATDWFNSIMVKSQVNNNNYQTKVIKLNALMSPRMKNIIESGIGYSTDIGPRLKGRWKKPWINDRGNSLISNAYVSLLERAIDIHYKIPLPKNPLEQYYTFSAALKNIFNNKTRSNTTIFSISRNWDNINGWQKAIDLNWSLDHFSPHKSTSTTILLYPGVSLYKNNASGISMPKYGYAQHYWINISNTIWGSNVDFVILRAQNIWIRTFAENHRFILRSSLGWIITNKFDNIPMSLRFFVGGDHSIRGYRYRSLSLRNNNGDLIGASKMATGSLEYQYNINNKWSSAIFIDSGEAVNNFKHSQSKIGVGFGFRWLSPIGAIKFDIAYPMINRNKHGIQLYVGLGSEL